MVLAALAGQAGAAVPGQQGATQAGSTSVAHEPIYHVVRNNHDLRQDLMKFWYRGLAKPRHLDVPISGTMGDYYTLFPSGCISFDQIIHGHGSLASTLGLKLVRIVLRYPNLMSRREHRHLQFMTNPSGFFLVKLRYYRSLKNVYWNNLMLVNGQIGRYSTQYIAFGFRLSRNTSPSHLTKYHHISSFIYHNNIWIIFISSILGQSQSVKQYLAANDSDFFQYLNHHGTFGVDVSVTGRCQTNKLKP